MTIDTPLEAADTHYPTWLPLPPDEGPSIRPITKAEMEEDVRRMDWSKESQLWFQEGHDEDPPGGYYVPPMPPGVEFYDVPMPPID